VTKKYWVLILSALLGLAILVFASLPSADRPLDGANTCPICLQTTFFVPAGDPPRARAGCPYCGSLERHRLLYLYLRQRTALFRDQLSVLHFSPERGLREVLENRKNLKYASSWYEPDRPADFHLDLTALALPDNSWDVLIVYHILEHIPDDRKAMREMFRVLKPGGWAVVQVPVLEQEETREDPTATTPQQRLEKFGNEDHVRFYGWKDFADRLAAAGFQVTIERFGQDLSDSTVREFALDRNERIYLLRKPR
jgi:SAM-dependent methyltransferase